MVEPNSDKRKFKYSEERRKNIGRGVSKRWEEFGHPRGALNKHWKWTEEQKKKIKGKPSHRKGKKMSEEYGVHISKGITKAFQEKPELHAIWSNAQKGRKHTEASKKKKSKSLKKYYKNNPEAKLICARIDRSRKGIILSEEHKEKIKEKNTGKKRTKKTKEKQRESRIKYMQRHHVFKDTSIEIKMQDELKRRKIQYETQKPLLKKYLVDIYVKPNVVIECDGDYWHNRLTAKERDEERNTNLKENGFRVYRFWEHEINTSTAECVDRILFKRVETL